MQGLQVSLEGRATLDEAVAQRVAGSSAQATVGGGVHELIQLKQFIEVLARAMAALQLVQATQDQLGTAPARGAEATTLVRKKLRKIAHHLEHVAGSVKHHEGACSG